MAEKSVEHLEEEFTLKLERLQAQLEAKVQAELSYYINWKTAVPIIVSVVATLGGITLYFVDRESTGMEERFTERRDVIVQRMDARIDEIKELLNDAEEDVKLTLNEMLLPAIEDLRARTLSIEEYVRIKRSEEDVFKPVWLKRKED